LVEVGLSEPVCEVFDRAVCDLDDNSDHFRDRNTEALKPGELVVG
jgi:hypothetical protein